MIEVSSTVKKFTWEEKIDNLAKLAKAAGRLLNADPGTDYYNDARGHLFALYAEFCEWRHEEPYIVDEIRGLLGQFEVSPLTGEVIRSVGDDQHD